MASLGVVVLHWACACATVPFGLGAFIFPNPERVSFVAEKVAVPVPRWFLGFCSSFVHLTVVSHELTAGYFVLALLRDHGFLAVAPAPGTGQGDWLEVCYAVATAIGLFVATVFWGSVLVDPALMCPVEEMFRNRDMKPLEVRRWLFKGLFGPPDPKFPMQGPFLAFMRYIHTVCPLLLVLEAALVDHELAPLERELRAGVAVAVGYLAWNFFCWWLLRHAPYPLQKRIWCLGTVRASIAYCALVGYAVLLLLCSRRMRWAEGAESVVAAAVPAAVVLWATSGLVPFKASLVRFQGLDPAETLVRAGKK